MTSASVRVTELDGVAVAEVSGEIDIVNAVEVGGQLFGIAPNTSPGLVVDLSGVTYMDSRGVHLLLDLANRLNMRHQQVHLVVPAHALIRRVLLLTHVDSVVPIHLSVEEALTALRTAS